MIDPLMDKAVETIKYNKNIPIGEYITIVSEEYFSLKSAQSSDDFLHGNHAHYLQFPFVIPYYQNGNFIGYIKDISWESNSLGGELKYTLEVVE